MWGDYRQVGVPEQSNEGCGKMVRLKQKINEELVPKLVEEFGYGNVMAIPKLVKVVVNLGLGQAIQNIKLLDSASDELTAITGQKPVVTRARKSIAGFKLRQGMPIGLMATLRGDRMFEFLDRLINIGLPRVRDFRGAPPNSFDGRGNFTLGLKDQLIFPEIDLGRTEVMHGMNITIVTTAKSDEEARFFLVGLGIPFGREEDRPLVF